MSGYKLLQYGSTFVGLPLLAMATMFSLNHVAPTHPAKALSTTHKLVVLCVLCLVPVLVAAFALSDESTAYQVLGKTIKRSGAIIVVLCIAYCVAINMFAGGRSDA